MSIWFDAHHFPIGAFATFTLGMPGARGGFGLERGGPVEEDVYVAIEDAAGGGFHALPFFGAGADDAARYEVEAAAAPGEEGLPAFRSFAREEVSRDFTATRDTWRAGDLTFTVHTQVIPVPDPETALRAALIPAMWAELTIDNRAGMRLRRGFFGYSGKAPTHSCARGWAQALSQLDKAELQQSSPSTNPELRSRKASRPRSCSPRLTPTTRSSG